MVEFFTEDVVLVGDTEEDFGREEMRAYLRAMADMEPTVTQSDHEGGSGTRRMVPAHGGED